MPEGYKRWMKVILAIAPSCPDIIAGIVQAESSWDPNAKRYEPAFYERYLEGDEYWQKIMDSTGYQYSDFATSWGLMQIMYTTAWDLGYREDPRHLLLGEMSLLYGTMYFLKLLDKYGTVEDAVAAYNAGTPRRADDGSYVNQAYVVKVLRFAQSYA